MTYDSGSGLNSWDWRKRRKSMPGTQKNLRVLVVDDDRDGADTLGMVVEELGSQVHVTYGGTSALDVATLFRPDLMLIDLAMPDMDGCHLVASFRQIPAFAQTKIVAITGHVDQGHKTLAMKAGFDKVLFKPVALTEIQSGLSQCRSRGPTCGPIATTDQQACKSPSRATVADQRSAKNQEGTQIKKPYSSRKRSNHLRGDHSLSRGILGMGSGADSRIPHQRPPGGPPSGCFDSGRTATGQVVVAGER